MSKTNKFRLGFDIGGTFTDFVMVNQETGATFLHKCLTTPKDPSIAVSNGMKSIIKSAGIYGNEIEIAIHGTTLITNALIERKGAHTGMITTSGFRDVLEMGTEVRYDIYDLFLEKPEPLVPRKWRFEVGERLDNNGNIVTPLDLNSIKKVIHELHNQKIESLAIVFLHSFRNPEHELKTQSILTKELPDLSISISSEVAPEIREYERMSTTVANAYVKPLTRRYIDKIEKNLKKIGYEHRLFLMISSGGITTSETAKAFPIRMVESGPAAGVLAAIFYGRNIGIESLVTFDMGGTTAKIGLIKDKKATKANFIEVGRVKRFKKGSGIPIKVPVIELIEIGAGGGSIAHVDELGLLKVGPESAGADPGPACYGKGGKKPTVTDADLILGYLNPDYFLGGKMTLYPDAASKVMHSLEKYLGISKQEVARGILEIVNQNMLAAMKVHIAERGEDPRKFYLFSFGGAGPAHAYELARSLNMKGIVIPKGAGATSAMGLITTEVSFDFANSYVTNLETVDWNEVKKIFESMANEGLVILRDSGISAGSKEIRIVHSMDLRHKGQGHEVSVDLPEKIYEKGSKESIKKLFYQIHKEKFGHAHTNLAVELITCRTVVGAPPPTLPLNQIKKSSKNAKISEKGKRAVYFSEKGKYIDTPVFDRYNLPPKFSLLGPAIIEEKECTVVAGPSSRVSLDSFGNLFIDLLYTDVDKKT